MSRVSTRSSASSGLSGDESSDDCLAHSAVEMMKGISRDSTPRSTSSSVAIGGWSGEWNLLVSGSSISKTGNLLWTRGV